MDEKKNKQANGRAIGKILIHLIGVMYTFDHLNYVGCCCASIQPRK